MSHEPSYELELTMDEMVETAKAINISIDVKQRRLVRANPNHPTYRGETIQLRNMIAARDEINEALSEALALQDAT